MKYLLSGFALLLALSTTSATPTPKPASAHSTHRTAATVYVCMSKTSYAYHSSDQCNGLNRCSHEVKAMSAEQAAELGKRACQKCY